MYIFEKISISFIYDVRSKIFFLVKIETKIYDTIYDNKLYINGAMLRYKNITRIFN